MTRPWRLEHGVEGRRAHGQEPIEPRAAGRVPRATTTGAATTRARAARRNHHWSAWQSAPEERADGRIVAGVVGGREVAFAVVVHLVTRDVGLHRDPRR